MQTFLCKTFTALAILIGFVSISLGAGADNFANRTTLSGVYVIETITDMETFTREANEPVHDPNPAVSGGLHTAWWRWVAPTDGFCTVEAPFSGQVILKKMSIYTGGSFASLTRVADGSLPPGFSCSTTFYAAAGTEYNIVVEAEGFTEVVETFLTLRHLPADSAGSYLGEWRSSFQELLPAGSGMLAIKIAPGGGVTGLLTAGATKYPFKTQLTTDGFVRASMARKTAPGQPLLPPITVTVDVPLALANLSNNFLPILPIAVSDGANVHGVGDIDRVPVFSSQSPTPVAGYHVAAINYGAALTGSGFLTTKISAAGLVKMVGVSGDGQKLALGSALITGNEIPFHQSFLAQRGYMNGRLRIIDGIPDRITGVGLQYFRPPITSIYYPTGIKTTVSVDGAAYRKPASGQRALNFLTATNGAGKLSISAAAGEIGGVVENLTFSAANTFGFASAVRSPKLKLNPATGIVSGSISEPAGTRRRLTGVLYDLNGTVRIRGFVSGAKRTTTFVVSP